MKSMDISEQANASPAPRAKRQGAVAVLFALCLVIIIGMIACAYDVGWMLMTKTQLQTAADASALAGGIELLPNLGYGAVASSTVVGPATTQAVSYAAKQPNGDVGASYLDSADVRFGWATYNSTSKTWTKAWGTTPYNMIGTKLDRDQVSSTNNDEKLPLIFGRIFGIDTHDVTANATAVILPASGFRIEPGSSESANLMPFAIRRGIWEKYLRAQADYAARGYAFPSPIDSVTDSVTGEPLYGHYVLSNQGNSASQVFVQDFHDKWSCSCAFDDKTSTITQASDNYLEIDVYPRDDVTAGNFGTVDFGANSNGTNDIERQITHGINADDFAYFPNNTISTNYDYNGETGVSAGFKDELEGIWGQCRAIALYDSISYTNGQARSGGNTADFYITEFVGVRVMHSELTGKLDFKHLSLQACKFVGNGAIGDLDDQITPSTTVFTPLILIE